ncbi:uncharacterized protein JCM15063_002262 [Sporobolomyces koalae]|uniref:uncharacterized protein n=1 Tax=Sporobolomyces koalae TaxID=500713 RepID=UPI003180AA1B
MSASRSGRLPPVDRAYQSQLEQAIKLSQAALHLSSDKQQTPLPSASATAPFQTLHGTLNNTSVDASDGGFGSALTGLSRSTSTDQILPSSLNTPLPPLPAPPKAQSLTSDPIKSVSDTAKASTVESDEIRTSFSTDSAQTKSLAGPVTSATEDTQAVSGGLIEMADRDEVPDSDNEGSGPASNPLGGLPTTSHEAVEMGLGLGSIMLPPLPHHQTGSSGTVASIQQPTAVFPSDPENVKLVSKQRAFVDVPALPGRNTKPTTSVSKAKAKSVNGRTSSLSRETVDSDDDRDIPETSVRKQAPQKVITSKSTRKRTLVQVSDDEGGSVAGNSSGRKALDAEAGAPSGSPLTDYEELAGAAMKTKKPRSSASSAVAKKNTPDTTRMSSPDPIAGDIETSSTSRQYSHKSASASARSLERQYTDEHLEQAKRINEQQDDDDDDYGAKKPKSRSNSKTKDKQKKGPIGPVRRPTIKKGSKTAQSAPVTEEAGAGPKNDSAVPLENDAIASRSTVSGDLGDSASLATAVPSKNKANEPQTSARVVQSKKNNVVLDSEDDAESVNARPDTRGTGSLASSKKGASSKGTARRKRSIEDSDEEMNSPANDLDKRTSHAQQQPTPSTSTSASTSENPLAAWSSPVPTRASCSTANKSVTPEISRTLSAEQKSARAKSKMNLVLEAANTLDSDAFNYPPLDKPKAKPPQKRKAVESDSDADHEDESEPEEDDDDTAKDGKAKGKQTQVMKENEGLPTPKPKNVAALARDRERSASPFSKTPKPGSLAAIIAARGIGSYRSPGLSVRAKIPALHTNLKPPPPAKKVIKEVRPVKKKKKGEESYSDEEKPWYEVKDPEEWDSDDCARWSRRQKRIERGLPADTDDDSD